VLRVPTQGIGDVQEITDDGDLPFLQDVGLGYGKTFMLLDLLGKALFGSVQQSQVIFVCHGIILAMILPHIKIT
jgi:hypothetical protein